MLRILLLAGPVVALAASAWGLQTPAPFKPGKLPKEEVAALQPGLTLRFYEPDTDRLLDTRRVRLAALYVAAGDPPSPFLKPGPFVARLTGYVKSALRSEYVFRCAVEGSAEVTVNGKRVLERGKEVSDTVELAKGYNRLEVRFASPPRGDAALRVYWSGEGFGGEPLPPEALFSSSKDADLASATRLREGRLLHATLGCAHCHALPAGIQPAMPEMRHQPPSLVEAGSRFRTGWLAQWIAAPRSLRPEATMPRLLHGEQAGQQAADIAAFLASLRGPGQDTPGGDAEQGQKLFRRLGCNACHHFQPPPAQDELARLSLHAVAAKFQPGALRSFLLQPHEHYPWIRMPDFKLSANEASDLAAYLAREAKTQVPGLASADAARGARLFREAGCIQCHRIDPKAPLAPPHLAALAPGAIANGCLASAPSGKAPDFGLQDEARQALAAFLKSDGGSLTRETPAEFSLRQVQALQCHSCHRRDGGTTRWHQVLEEEGLMPEALPSLSWAGDKLQHEWAKRLLAGQADQRARPWLKARMPAFPARAVMLAEGLAHEHGYSIAAEPPPKVDPQLAAVGAKLLPQQGGFNCIMCHGVGKLPALEPYEAPGINLLDAALRLRAEYYRRWMLNPTRVDVVTRMPVFSQDGKTTQLRDVFDGDAQRQFEAIWHHMHTLK